MKPRDPYARDLEQRRPKTLRDRRERRLADREERELKEELIRYESEREGQ